MKNAGLSGSSQPVPTTSPPTTSSSVHSRDPTASHTADACTIPLEAYENEWLPPWQSAPSSRSSSTAPVPSSSMRPSPQTLVLPSVESAAKSAGPAYQEMRRSA